MAYFNVDLPPELRSRLDKAATKRLAERRPMSQYAWLQTPEGKRVFGIVSAQPEWRRRPIEEVNAYVKQQYIEATGGPAKGRPQLAQARTDIIKDALELYFAAEAK